MRKTLSSKKRMKKKGQSTIEYLILVAVVVAVFIAFLNGVFREQYNQALAQGSNGLLTQAGRLSNSHFSP